MEKERFTSADGPRDPQMVKRIPFLPFLSKHTRLRIAEEFLRSCAAAGLLFIVDRRLRVPVHNKLPIRRGQMIVFRPGSSKHYIRKDEIP